MDDLRKNCELNHPKCICLKCIHGMENGCCITHKKNCNDNMIGACLYYKPGEDENMNEEFECADCKIDPCDICWKKNRCVYCKEWLSCSKKNAKIEDCFVCFAADSCEKIPHD